MKLATKTEQIGRRFQDSSAVDVIGKAKIAVRQLFTMLNNSTDVRNVWADINKIVKLY